VNPDAERDFNVRPHTSEDLEWVVQAHGEYYARAFGWDASFEAMCAGIVDGFRQTYDPDRERGWIAVLDGERVGCVFLMSESRDVARLRLLLVDPGAQGLGLGRDLVARCVSHAKTLGYARIALTTVESLDPARRLYVDAGFILVGAQPTTAWGADHVLERWEAALR